MPTLTEKWDVLNMAQRLQVLRDRPGTMDAEALCKMPFTELSQDEVLNLSVVWYHSYAEQPKIKVARGATRVAPETKGPAPKRANPYKKFSRASRWAEACADAKAALEVLEELRGEYESWKDNLPEGLDSSPTAEKLESVVDLDIQSAIDLVDECENADLPLGFGRD